MKDAAQRDVWESDPSARVCSQLQPAGHATEHPDGISLSGSWNFASGCHHAQWSLVGFPILDANGTPVDQGLALIPIRECRIEESWFVCGMAATASDTLHAEKLRVPEHRIVRFSSLVTRRYPTEHTEEALFRTPMAPLGTLMVAPVIVGLAKAAFETTLRQLSSGTKRVAYTFVQDTRQTGITQVSLAQASALLDSAFLQLRAAADALDAAASAGDPMTRETRSFQRMRLAHAMKSARQAVDLLLDVQGASAFALANPVQRMWRDMNVASRHGFVHPENNQGVYGRAIAGVEETVTPFA
jgi:alkylation response protein AidB-like acyl-CoA dehydrogenase